MSILEFSSIVFCISFFAGIIGALTGLGGGILIIPCMVLFLHVDIHYAMGAGLFAVMATSAGAAMAYFREGYINIRLGIFLEVAAAVGAVVGAVITGWLSASLVQTIFGTVFLVMAYLTWRRREEYDLSKKIHPVARYLGLDGQYPTKEGLRSYHVQHVWSGFFLMGIAGVFSGLLGIGSGSMKVVAMDQVMRLPYKVSTSTSNFIIGITAAVGASVFFHKGYIDPVTVFPVVLGIVPGALCGARFMAILPVKPLRLLFSIVILLLALQMIYHGLGS